MKIVGIDFTSAPKKSKPLTSLICNFSNAGLKAEKMIEWVSFEGFEGFLKSTDSWIAGIDFPFGQSRKFIENIGWPKTWRGYVEYVSSMDRSEFRKTLDQYKELRPFGDKEHLRHTDLAASALSPQKQYGVPIGLMFFEGAPRLLKSGATLPGLLKGDSKRLIVEAYPGVLAKRLIGRRGYKQDSLKKQTLDQANARHDILTKLINGACHKDYGFSIEAPNDICDDPTGDQLDAFLCAVQAAWAWKHRERNYGAPTYIDPLEGWIADPKTCERMNKSINEVDKIYRGLGK